jgi:hypothetical protein
MNSSNLSVTYTSQLGNIVRVPIYSPLAPTSSAKFQNFVQFSVSGTVSFTTASGSLYIDGLPYTNALSVVQNLGFGAPMSSITWTATTGTPVWSINASGTTIQWHILESGASPPLQQITSIASGGTFTLSGQGSYISSN